MNFDKYKGKFVFVSHPLKSNPVKNKKSADRICKYLLRKGIYPVSPIHLFWIYQSEKGIRDRIMDFCYQLIKESDAVFIFGDSEGCRLERQYAQKIGKPVEIFYNEHKDVNFISCKYLMSEKKGVKQ